MSRIDKVIQTLSEVRSLFQGPLGGVKIEIEVSEKELRSASQEVFDYFDSKGFMIIPSDPIKYDEGKPVSIQSPYGRVEIKTK